MYPYLSLHINYRHFLELPLCQEIKIVKKKNALDSKSPENDRTLQVHSAVIFVCFLVSEILSLMLSSHVFHVIFPVLLLISSLFRSSPFQPPILLLAKATASYSGTNVGNMLI